MKEKYLYLIVLLLLMLGCEDHPRLAQEYVSQNHVFKKNSNLNIFSIIISKKPQPTSQFQSSAPYKFKFFVLSETPQKSPVLVHSLKLTAGSNVILDEHPSRPITIKLEKESSCQYHYDAILVRELGKKLPFKEGLKLESQVEWEIQGIRSKQVLKTQFVGKTTEVYFKN